MTTLIEPISPKNNSLNSDCGNSDTSETKVDVPFTDRTPDLHTSEELLRIAHQRLYPSLANPNFLALRSRRKILTQWINQLPSRQLEILDLGGRYQPYRPLLNNRIGRYVALDVKKSALLDVVGWGQQLPFRSNAFDLVIATSVFEWFPEPRIPAEEVLRVLKPGGHLMMSVASIQPSSGDAECWRFLPAGLKFVLAPFSQAEIVPEVGSIGGFLRYVATALSVFAKYNFMRQIVHHTVVPMINILGLALDRPGVSANDHLSGNYSALARKAP